MERPKTLRDGGKFRTCTKELKDADRVSIEIDPLVRNEDVTSSGCGIKYRAREVNL